MQVTLGNPTLQHRDFQYRVPGQKTTRTVKIAPGGQAKLPDDLSGPLLDNVIAQLERFGAVPVKELGGIVVPKQLIYNVSQTPIKVDAIAEGLEHDETARQEVSAAKLEEAGLGAFTIAEQSMRGQRLRPIETVVEVVETNDRGPVDGGINTEYVVSAKPNRRAGRKRTEQKN